MYPLKERFNKALKIIGESHLRESLAVIIATTTFGLGVSYIFLPSFVAEIPAYKTTFDLVAPEILGVSMVGLSTILSIMMFTSKQQAMWPSLGLTILFIFITITNLDSLGSRAVTVPVWGNFTVALVCSVLTASCAVYQSDEERTDAKSTS